MNKAQIKEKVKELKERFPIHVAVFENDSQVILLIHYFLLKAKIQGIHHTIQVPIIQPLSYSLWITAFSCNREQIVCGILFYANML